MEDFSMYFPAVIIAEETYAIIDKKLYCLEELENSYVIKKKSLDRKNI